jgi:hypothetical protein
LPAELLQLRQERIEAQPEIWRVRSPFRAATTVMEISPTRSQGPPFGAIADSRSGEKAWGLYPPRVMLTDPLNLDHLER